MAKQCGANHRPYACPSGFTQIKTSATGIPAILWSDHAPVGGYRRLVEWSLNNRFIVFAITAALIAGSYWLARDMGTEFLPATDEGSFSIAIHMPEGSPLESTDELVSRFEEILDRHESVAMYSVTIGQGDSLTSMSLSRNASAEITATVTPEVLRDKTTHLVMEDVEEQVNKSASDEVAFNCSPPCPPLPGAWASGSVSVRARHPRSSA